MRQVVVWLAVGLTWSGCATTQRSSAKASGETMNQAAETYVDRELGLEISPPQGEWHMETSQHRDPDGTSIPVILRHSNNGAQVVIQVAPSVASPLHFAERLAAGLDNQPGFITSEPLPLSMGEGAVGFEFTMGEAVAGRVAVLSGLNGRIFLLMATWPTGATEAMHRVDEVFRTVRPLPTRPAGGDGA